MVKEEYNEEFAKAVMNLNRAHRKTLMKFIGDTS